MPTQTPSTLYDRMTDMANTIRISDAPTELLDRQRRDDGSYDKLISRLAREDEAITTGVWDEEQAETAREIIERSRESFGRDR